MAITCGEKVNEPDRRFLASCISKSSAITQDTIETRGTTKQFIARYGDNRFANGEYERRTHMVAINGDEDDCRTTFEVIDVIADKDDARGNIVDTSGCEEDRSATMGHTGEAFVSDDDKEDVTTSRKMDASFDAPMYPRYHVDDVIPMDILPESRHRDGSIYRATHMWKKNYNIADRTESK
jgi:hypothetical protein